MTDKLSRVCCQVAPERPLGAALVNRSVSVLILLLAAILPLLPARGGGAGPIEEPFETFTDGMPAGWMQSAAGELLMQVQREIRSPKEGKACWRIDVPMWYAGAAVLTRTGVRLRRDQPYAAEVWLRGRDLNVPVSLSLERRSASPHPYLAREFAVGTEWRRFVLEGSAPVDDPDAVFRIRIAGSGTLYVDALRVGEGSPSPEPEPARPAPPVKGNRIHNSSFEVGTDGWTPPDRLALPEGAASEGERFARWPPGAGVLEARPFIARPEQPYTASAFLRAPRTGARVEMALVEGGGGPRAAMTFSPTTEWQRYSFGGVLPCERSAHYVLALRSLDPAHGFEVDAVQVEEGDLTDYRPAAAVEVGCALPRTGRFPRPDTILPTPVQVYAPGKAGREVTLHYRLDGFYGEGLAVGISAVVPGLTHARVPLRVRIPQSGALRLTVEAYSGRTAVSRSEAMLAAFPGPEIGDPAQSFVGVGGSPGAPGEWHAAMAAARAGIRWWRLQGAARNASSLWWDAEIGALRSRGMSLLGAIGGPGKPTVLASQAAVLYQGRIAAYEVTLRPEAPTGPEAPGEMAQASAVIRKLRAANARALLVAGPWPDAAPTPPAVGVVRGIASAADALSLAQVTRPEDLAYLTRGRDHVTVTLQALRARLSAAGVSKPLWVTEGSTPCPGYATWLGAEEQSRAAARTVAKTLVLNRANGVRRYFYAQMAPDQTADRLPTSDTALLDEDGGPKPALSALAVAGRQLADVEPGGRVEAAEVKAYVFKQGAGTLVAAWSPTALVDPLALSLKLDPFHIHAVDLMGNSAGVVGGKGTATVSLHNEPLYIEVQNTPPAAVLRALQAATTKPR